MQVVTGYLLADRANDELEMPVVPGAQYVPLYEGRMVHQFDHAAKAYVSGEGRGARWDDLSIADKSLVPHYYVIAPSCYMLRAAFCLVTGQTNERSMLASLLPPGFPSGHSLAVGLLDQDQGSEKANAVLLSLLNSFVVDFALRQKITTNMTLNSVLTCPIFRPLLNDDLAVRLATAAGRLSSITPEIQLAKPALDWAERADLRAEIDSAVAGLYRLSASEFAYILSTFPLLDRDQPHLPGDVFVRWNKKGKPKEEPRSYVTRDAALLAYFHHLNQQPPSDLATWYRDEVGINMIDDPACPYRMGTVRSLEARVAEYQKRGAIAYIPSKAKKWDPDGPYQPQPDSILGLMEGAE